MQERALSWRLLRDHAFALVSPGCRAQLPTGVVTRSLASDALADSGDLLPELLDLATLTDAQADALCTRMEAQQQEGEFPSLCALIAADTGCDETRARAHLAAMQILRGPRDAKAWMRLHDPRVWIQLQRTMSRELLRGLFGPFTFWTVPLGSEWWRFQRPPAPVEPVPHRLMRAEEWAALARIGAVNRALARLGIAQDCLAIRRMSPQLDAWVQRAQTKYGMDRMDDLAAFAWFAAEVHPDFDRHPVGVAALAAAGGDTHVADLLESISAEQRETIRVDLTQGTDKPT